MLLLEEVHCTGTVLHYKPGWFVQFIYWQIIKKKTLPHSLAWFTPISVLSFFCTDRSSSGLCIVLQFSIWSLYTQTDQSAALMDHMHVCNSVKQVSAFVLSLCPVRAEDRKHTFTFQFPVVSKFRIMFHIQFYLKLFFIPLINWDAAYIIIIIRYKSAPSALKPSFHHL